MRRVSARFAVLRASFVAVLVAAAPASAQVQAGTLVQPETTTVGQHFIATVKIRVPAGTAITFPTRPDSGAHVDSAGAQVRRDSSAAGFTYATARYVLAAWDTGTQALGFRGVTIVTPSGSSIVPLNGFKVYVRSVLPRDTTLRKPKPFRPKVPLAGFNWLPWLFAAIAVALLAALLYAWRKWRERRRRGPSAYEVAEREFVRIEQDRLIEAGQPERHAVEMVRVLRVYLAAVVPAARRSATTHELAFKLRSEGVVPAHRFIAVLDETDRIKFAAQRSTADRARDIGVEARAIVKSVRDAIQAREAEALRAKAA